MHFSMTLPKLNYIDCFFNSFKIKFTVSDSNQNSNNQNYTFNIIMIINLKIIKKVERVSHMKQINYVP